MSLFESQYKQLLMTTLLNKEMVKNRTGVDAHTIFNQTLNVNLNNGFPILTAKKIFFDKAKAEFEWIYNGRTDIKFLHDHNIKWWDKFAKNNKLGKVYGYQVRKFGDKFDQVEYCINEINNNSRRAVITFWNPNDLPQQALPNCYTSFCFVRQGNNLNMQMNFRSSDLFLGLPYDIIVGALFLIEIAKQTNLKPNILGLSIANGHIYENHYDQVKKYYRTPVYELPQYKNEKLINYKSAEYIKAKLN